MGKERGSPRPFLADVGAILRWAAFPCTPFTEYMLLRLLRHSMDLPPPALLGLQVRLARGTMRA